MTLFIYVVVFLVMLYWLYWKLRIEQSVQLPTPFTGIPDRNGRYMVTFGVFWSRDSVYKLLADYGMDNRPASDYRRAFEQVVNTFEREAGALTDSVVTWEWRENYGTVYTDRPVEDYAWGYKCREAIERAAIMGRNGKFRTVM